MLQIQFNKFFILGFLLLLTSKIFMKTGYRQSVNRVIWLIQNKLYFRRFY